MIQLIINRFNLPNELLTMIKDFALLTREKKTLMYLHKQIHNKIIYAQFFTIQLSKTIYRWQDSNGIFIAYFCKCGNYIYCNIYICKNALCNCCDN